MRIDVGKTIDNCAVGRFQMTIVLVGAMVMIIDGYDLAAMGIVVPRISEQWGMEPSSFSIALSVAMLGIMIGSGVAGFIGDLIGRRLTMVMTVLVAGLFMLLTAGATTMTELVVYRLLTGIGAGGCIPIAIAYASEYMPLRLRNRLVVLMYTGAGIGSMVASLAAPTIIARYDWQGVFAIGGILSLLVGLIVLAALPESLKFLVSRGADSSAAGPLLKRIDRSFEPSSDDEYFLTEHMESSKGSPVRELFGGERTRITLLVWIVMFANQFMVFLITVWMPTLLTEAGFSLQASLYIVAMYAFGGAVGGVIIAAFADRAGAGRVLTVTYPVAGVCVGALGVSLGLLPALIVATVCSGVFLVGSSFCLGPYVASLYPTRARTTGIGWALGIGRIGSVVSPLVGGFALAQGYEIRTILFGAGLPPILCGLLVLWLNRFVSSGAGGQPDIQET